MLGPKQVEAEVGVGVGEEVVAEAEEAEKTMKRATGGDEGSEEG